MLFRSFSCSVPVPEPGRVDRGAILLPSRAPGLCPSVPGQALRLAEDVPQLRGHAQCDVPFPLVGVPVRLVADLLARLTRHSRSGRGCHRPRRYARQQVFSCMSEYNRRASEASGSSDSRVCTPAPTISKGLCSPAQGCETRANLRKEARQRSIPTGLRQLAAGGVRLRRKACCWAFRLSIAPTDSRATGSAAGRM